MLSDALLRAAIAENPGRSRCVILSLGLALSMDVDCRIYKPLRVWLFEYSYQFEHPRTLAAFGPSQLRREKSEEHRFSGAGNESAYLKLRAAASHALACTINAVACETLAA
jgi:hypothetical protein